MSRIDLDKLRSINFGGRTRGMSRVREVVNEDTGRRSGFQVDHEDGRQEAIVRPPTTRAKMSLNSGEVSNE